MPLTPRRKGAQSNEMKFSSSGRWNRPGKASDLLDMRWGGKVRRTQPHHCTSRRLPDASRHGLMKRRKRPGLNERELSARACAAGLKSLNSVFAVSRGPPSGYAELRRGAERSSVSSVRGNQSMRTGPCLTRLALIGNHPERCCNSKICGALGTAPASASMRIHPQSGTTRWSPMAQSFIPTEPEEISAPAGKAGAEQSQPRSSGGRVRLAGAILCPRNDVIPLLRRIETRPRISV